jgi:hypothetical protein
VDSEPKIAALRELLGNADLTCPSCGYSLDGLTTTVCPECGRTLQLAFVSQRLRASVPAGLVLWWAILTGPILLLTDFWGSWAIYKAGVPIGLWDFVRNVYPEILIGNITSLSWAMSLTVLGGSWQVVLLRNRAGSMSRRMRRATFLVCAILLFSVPMLILASWVF